MSRVKILRLCVYQIMILSTTLANLIAITSPSSRAIQWTRPSAECPCIIEYGSNSPLELQPHMGFSNPAGSRYCVADISIPEQSTKIYYRIVGTTANTSIISMPLRPAPHAIDDFTNLQNSIALALFGDMAASNAPVKPKNLKHARRGWILPSLVNEVDAGQVDGVLYCGDVAYEFFGEVATTFLANISPISSKVFFHSAIGNHELLHAPEGSLDRFLTEFQNQFRRQKPSPQEPVFYHSFDYQWLHIIFIDTEMYGQDFAPENERFAYRNEHSFTWEFDQSPDRMRKQQARTRQQNWLEQDLRGIDRSTTPFVIVVGHRPPFQCDPAFYQDIGTLLDKHRVDLYACGHQHSMTYFRATNIPNDIQGRPSLRFPPIMLSGAAGNTKKLKPLNPNKVPKYFHMEHESTDYGYGHIIANATALFINLGHVSKVDGSRFQIDFVKQIK